MRAFLLFPFFFFFLCNPARLFSQNDTAFIELPDSVREKEHSPVKASLMSICLPGLGQVYNKKYWKVPVIYAGFGVMTYFIYTNTSQYLDYKCAYIESSQGNMDGNYSDLVQKYTPDQLLSTRNYYRRNLEISIMFTAIWYILNIVDAAVDAHLYTFNITDNLSMQVDPAIISSGYGFKPAGGMKFSLHFR